MFNDDTFKNISLKDPVKSHLPEIIEVFVKFYGEKYREKITNNLNHTLFVYIQKPENDELEKIKILFAQKREERIYQYFNENNLDSFSVEEFSKLNFEKWIKDVHEGNISPLLSKFIHDFMGFNKSNTYVLLNTKQAKKMVIEILQNHLKDFNKCLSDLDDLKTEQEKISSYLISANKNRADLLQSYTEKSSKILLNYLKKGVKIENFDDVEPFLTTLREIILKEPALRNQDDEAVIEKVWSLCNKQNGINKEEFNDLLLGKNLLKELSKLHNDYIDKLLKSYPSVERIMTEIKNNGLFEGAILSSIENYILTPKSDVVAFIEPTYYESDPNTLYNFCVLPTIFSLYDSTVFHELNHIVVSDILSNTDKNLIVKSGLQVSSFDKDLNISIGAIKKSILNEVINDYISLKICREYEKNGKKIGLLNNISSAYSKAFPLLKDFMEDNLFGIIECLMEKDKDIKNLIGNENFDIIADATRNILVDYDSAQMFKKITSRFGLSDINEIIDLDNLQLSEIESNYINNYRQANYVTNKIKLEKLHSQKEGTKISNGHVSNNDIAGKKKKSHQFDINYSREFKQ